MGFSPPSALVLGVEKVILENVSIDDIEVKNGIYGCASAAGVSDSPSGTDGILVIYYVPGLFAIRLYLCMDASKGIYIGTRPMFGQYNWSSWVNIK